MIITITHNDDPPSFSDVRTAKRMVQEYLLEFLGDRNSERRLIYELAMNAKGTHSFQRTEGVVREECHLSHRLVWMKLVELPSAGKNVKQLTPHGKYLFNEQELIKGRDTSCSIEVYGFNEHGPELNGPYVLVSGNSSDGVNEVAARVAEKISEHQQGCPKNGGSQFYN